MDNRLLIFYQSTVIDKTNTPEWIILLDYRPQNHFSPYFKFLLIISIISVEIVFAQAEKYDTLQVKAGSTIEFFDSQMTITRDTLLILPQNTKYMIYKGQDSTSQEFYKSIKKYSEKSKLFELLHNSIIVEKKSSQDRDISFDKSSEEYEQYKGKIISNIRYKKVRLFSGSVFDTTNLINQENEGFFEKIHYDSRDATIEKYITFHIGEKIDPYRISDTERILRNLSFIEDAKIILIPQESDENKIDVLVVTKDRFSLGINLTPHSISRYSTTVFNRNILGYGWNLELKYTFNSAYTPPHGIETNFDFNNIQGTFIDASIGYAFDAENEKSHLLFTKSFLTTETKYGGGLGLENIHSFNLDNNFEHIPFTYNYEDFWAGRQLSVSKIDRRKTVILAGRVSRREFTFRPYVESDSNYFYYNQNMALGSVIYSKIDFFKARMVYGFGITEDVPVGFRISVTSGLRYEDFDDNFYFGVSAGRTYMEKSFGFLLYSFKAGTFYNGEEFRQGVVNLSAYFISPLLSYNIFKLRHFLFISYTQGFNRQREYYLYLNGEDGIRGLNINDIQGTKRFDMSYETVSFTPFNFYGFRFAMFNFVDIGFISNDKDIVFKNKMYSGIGIGWRIKNESLVFGAIQIRLAYYPNVTPGSGKFGFDIKTNETRLFENIFPVKPNVIGFE